MILPSKGQRFYLAGEYPPDPEARRPPRQKWQRDNEGRVLLPGAGEVSIQQGLRRTSVPATRAVKSRGRIEHASRHPINPVTEILTTKRKGRDESDHDDEHRQ